MTTTEQPQTVESPATETPATETAPAEATPARHEMLEKAPTPLHRRYAQYIVEKFGYELPGAEMPESFFDEGNPGWERLVKLVQIAVVKYGEFQRSPENAEHKALAAQRADEERAKAEAEKKAKAEAKAAEKAKADAEKSAAKATTAKTDDGAADGAADAPKTRKAAPAVAKKGGSGEAPF